MTPRHIAIIDGHPDPDPARFCHALAAAYAEGAAQAGHAVERITLAALDVPLLRSRVDWETGPPPPAIRPAQEAIGRAGHLVILYPLWLGTLPAVLKAFLEQALRPGFAFTREDRGRLGGRPALGGRSARIVVTMGMPALIYRWYFGAHSLKSLERNVLRFVGIRPIRETLIGGVEAIGDKKRRAWLGRMRALGRDAR